MLMPATRIGFISLFCLIFTASGQSEPSSAPAPAPPAAGPERAPAATAKKKAPQPQWVVFVDPKERILDLKWEFYRDSKTGNAVVEGSYQKKGWSLYAKGKKIKLGKGGKYKVTFPIKGKSASVRLEARGLRGTRQRQNFKINVRQFKSYSSRTTAKSLTDKGYGIIIEEMSLYRQSQWWSRARIGLVAGLDSLGGNTFTGEIGWYPVLPITPIYDLSFRGDLRFSLLKDRTGPKFLSIAYGITAARSWPFLEPIHLELGLGLQTWLDRHTKPQISLGAIWPQHWRWKSVLFNELYFRYSLYFASVATTHFFTLGVALAI